jgi:hypothetical protein
VRQGEVAPFAEDNLGQYLDRLRAQLARQVRSLNEDYVLAVVEEEYVSYLVAEYTVERLDLAFDEWTVDSTEREIDAKLFPPGSLVRAGECYPKPVFVFRIPIRGNADLLPLRPSQWSPWAQKMYVSRENLCFEVVDFSADPDAIRQSAENTRVSLTTQLSYLRADVDRFNESLPELAAATLRRRKDEITKRRGVMEAIGVPIHRKSDAPSVTTIPSPAKRKKIQAQPSAAKVSRDPEYTLPDTAYADILDVLHQVGVMFEQHPSLYEGKNEEQLRDVLLAFLQPQFEGTATGETFNKSGKTDILLRHQEKNIFVAECVIWDGPQKLQEKIDQLLGYLTWRDSKTALVVFVRNPNISRIQQSLREAVPRHANYLGTVKTIDDSQIEYRFHLAGDKEREIRVTVLVFHVPES